MQVELADVKLDEEDEGLTDPEAEPLKLEDTLARDEALDVELPEDDELEKPPIERVLSVNFCYDYPCKHLTNLAPG